MSKPKQSEVNAQNYRRLPCLVYFFRWAEPLATKAFSKSFYNHPSCRLYVTHLQTSANTGLHE